MTSTPPLLTELEAVNMMLSVIGESPVNTLTGASTKEAAGLPVASCFFEENRGYIYMGLHL